MVEYENQVRYRVDLYYYFPPHDKNNVAYYGDYWHTIDKEASEDGIREVIVRVLLDEIRNLIDKQTEFTFLVGC